MHRTLNLNAGSRKLLGNRKTVSPSTILHRNPTARKLPALPSTFKLHKTNILRKSLTPRKKAWSMSKDSKPMIDDFIMMRVIGTGTFSKVRIARAKHTSEIVVIKIMSKATIVKKRQIEHVKNEKNILQALDNPFLVNLKCSFQDRERLYIIQEYVPGGELYKRLRNKGRFSIKEAAFYAAEVASGIDYMHQNSTVYRDLKPENLLLSETGHIKIADLGFAKILNRDGQTFTLCGTPEYLAPEVIRQTGHDYGCDWWGIGILIYEMLQGHAPFLDANPFRMYEKILNDDVQYPGHFPPSVKNLLEQLLIKDHTQRIKGAGVKAHEFFSGFNWEEVARLGLTPPFVPSVRCDDDVSNFDEYPEEPESQEKIPVSSDLFINF